MKTLLSPSDRNEILDRLAKVHPDSQPRWGTMSAHQMLCHLSDSFRASLGEKYISPSSTFSKRTLYKWVALWVPLRWPRGIKTRPEMDQQQRGTPPEEFASDLDKLRVLLERLCTSEGEFAPHAMLGQMSRAEHVYDNVTELGEFLMRRLQSVLKLSDADTEDSEPDGSG